VARIEGEAEERQTSGYLRTGELAATRGGGRRGRGRGGGARVWVAVSAGSLVVTGSLLWHGPSDSNGWTGSRGVLDTCYMRLGFNYSAKTGITWTVRLTKSCGLKSSLVFRISSLMVFISEKGNYLHPHRNLVA
jgi:hypothetical protein